MVERGKQGVDFFCVRFVEAAQRDFGGKRAASSGGNGFVVVTMMLDGGSRPGVDADAVALLDADVIREDDVVEEDGTLEAVIICAGFCFLRAEEQLCGRRILAHAVGTQDAGKRRPRNQRLAVCVAQNLDVARSVVAAMSRSDEERRQEAQFARQQDLLCDALAFHAGSPSFFPALFRA